MAGLHIQGAAGPGGFQKRAEACRPRASEKTISGVGGPGLLKV